MDNIANATSQGATTVPRGGPLPTQPLSQRQISRRLGGFAVFIAVLSIGFLRPLFELVRVAATNEIYSYILLIPFISLYLVGLKKKSLAAMLSSSPRSALAPLLVAIVAVAWSCTTAFHSSPSNHNNYLPIAMFAFLAFILCGCLFFLGSQLTKAIWFPLAFLLLLVPPPSNVMDGIETFLQYASAEAAYILFQLSGTPVFKEGLVFTLPRLVIHVARECSGIRSTLVLFITSILAGQLFLRSPWTRAILTLAVVPIGIIRNGFRILTIALLTIHVDPEAIHGPIHRKGGPPFFILSLIAFFALLFLLRWIEGQKKHESKIELPPRK